MNLLELWLRNDLIISLPELDQTPTPTRFLKNIEESGLFDELQTNPFDQVMKYYTTYCMYCCNNCMLLFITTTPHLNIDILPDKHIA